MSSSESFMGQASSRPLSAHAKQQVKLQKRGQQWYGRPAAFFSAGKPCSINAIGAVTGTQHAFEPRTKEQGLADLAEPSDGVSGPWRTIGDGKGVLCPRVGVC